MVFNNTDEIEQCYLVYKVGTVMTKSEWEILFMIICNNITSYHILFMNGVSMIF